jgi:hypothetical protein
MDIDLLIDEQNDNVDYILLTFVFVGFAFISYYIFKFSTEINPKGEYDLNKEVNHYSINNSNKKYSSQNDFITITNDNDLNNNISNIVPFQSSDDEDMDILTVKLEYNQTQAPSGRIGSNMAIDELCDYILLIGGEINKKEKKKSNYNNNKNIENIENSTDPKIDIDEEVFNFFNKNELNINDDSNLKIFSTYEKTWQCYSPKLLKENTAPIYANSVILQGRVFTFGGINKDNKVNNDLLSYDFEKYQWKKIKIKSSNNSKNIIKPSPRYNTEFKSIGTNSAILFGGINQFGEVLKDSFLLEIINENYIKWHVISSLYPYHTIINDIKSIDINICEQGPSIDNGCLSAYIGCGRLVVIGNSNYNDEKLGNVAVFELDVTEENNTISNCSGNWLVHKTVGRGPIDGDLYGGSAHWLSNESDENNAIIDANDEAYEDGRILVISTENNDCCFFNSIYLLEISSSYTNETIHNTMIWSKLLLDWQGDLTSFPGLRLFPAVSLNKKSGIIYIFGGHSGDGEAKDGLITINYDNLIKNNVEKENETLLIKEPKNHLKEYHQYKSDIDRDDYSSCSDDDDDDDSISSNEDDI